jgi:hypothetical protein
MSRWKWTILIFELVLFAVILILPQVNLPDFTFHRGTAPVAARSSVLLASLRVPASISLILPLPVANDAASLEDHPQTDPVDSNSRLTLLCTLIC